MMMMFSQAAAYDDRIWIGFEVKVNKKDGYF